MIDSDRNRWNEKYKTKKLFLKWPDEMVVRFVSKYMNNTIGTCVLDLGCGSGRHSELLANNGYQVYGCDISKNSINITKKRLKSLGLKGDFIDAYSWNLPYNSNFFNFAIAWHSIYYNSFENIKKTIAEINRVLKNQGLLLASFISTSDFRRRNSKLVSKNTYLGNKYAYDHTSLTYCVPSLQNLKNIFSKNSFKIISTGYHEMYFNPSQRTCHWVVIAKKTI